MNHQILCIGLFYRNDTPGGVGLQFDCGLPISPNGIGEEIMEYLETCYKDWGEIPSDVLREQIEALIPDKNELTDDRRMLLAANIYILTKRGEILNDNFNGYLVTRIANNSRQNTKLCTFWDGVNP